MYRSANHLKMACPEGHEYTSENTYISKEGRRHCRACRALKGWGRHKAPPKAVSVPRVYIREATQQVPVSASDDPSVPIVSTPAASSPNCPPHWWLLESPSGPTCNATCRKCGKQRTFNTTDEDDRWPASMKAKRLKGGETVSRQAKQFRT